MTYQHHGRRLNTQPAFRSRLLQFALVFTHRLHHTETWTTPSSLAQLREQNNARGDYWQHHTEHSPALPPQSPFDPQKSFPLSDGTLHQNRSALASTLNIPLDQRRCVTDISGTTSLHCLLPLLIELTAARVDLDDDWLPTTEWFELLGQFMLQAVVEEYLCNGAYGPETFNTIFAFGCPGVDRWAEEPGCVTAMRRLFCAEDTPRVENGVWTQVKQAFINEVCKSSPSHVSPLRIPAPPPDLTKHPSNMILTSSTQLLPTAPLSPLQAIENASKRHPYASFEDTLLLFLRHLHDSLVLPDLAQVEQGRINIDGNELSEAESRAMIMRMGL